jgi:hypothetical protein
VPFRPLPSDHLSKGLSGPPRTPVLLPFQCCCVAQEPELAICIRSLTRSLCLPAQSLQQLVSTAYSSCKRLKLTTCTIGAVWWLPLMRHRPPSFARVRAVLDALQVDDHQAICIKSQPLRCFHYRVALSDCSVLCRSGLSSTRPHSQLVRSARRTLHGTAHTWLTGFSRGVHH